MSSINMFIVTDSMDANTTASELAPASQVNGSDAWTYFRSVGNYFDSATIGARSISTVVQTGVAKASGTITLSSMVATDTITINGTTFTCVASGATGNQFNVGGTDTITAANAAAAINASATANVSKAVVATSALAVITITALVPGYMGNLGTLAISAHGSVSGAHLSGGSVTASATVAEGI